MKKFMNIIVIFFMFTIINSNVEAKNLEISIQNAGWRNAIAELVAPTGLFIKNNSVGDEEIIIQSTKPYAALARCSYNAVDGKFVTKEVLIPPSFKGSLGEAISLYDSPYAFFNEFDLRVLPTAEIVETGLTDKIIGKTSSCIIVLGSKKDMSASAVAMILSGFDLATSMVAVMVEQTTVTKKGGKFLKAMSASIKNRLMLEALKDTSFQNGIYADIVNSNGKSELLERVSQRALAFFNKHKNKLIDATLKAAFKKVFSPHNVSSELIGKGFDKAILAAKSLAVVEKIQNIVGISSHLVARKNKGRSVIAFFVIKNKRSSQLGYVSNPLDYPLFVDIDPQSILNMKLMYLQARRVTFPPDYRVGNQDYYSPSKSINTKDFLLLIYDLEVRRYKSYQGNFDSYLNDFQNSHLFDAEVGSSSNNLKQFISYKDALYVMHQSSKRIMGSNYGSKIQPLCKSGFRRVRAINYYRNLRKKINLPPAYRGPIKIMYFTSSPPIIRTSTNFNSFLSRGTAATLLYDLVKIKVPCFYNNSRGGS